MTEPAIRLIPLQMTVFPELQSDQCFCLKWKRAIQVSMVDDFPVALLHNLDLLVAW